MWTEELFSGGSRVYEENLAHIRDEGGPALKEYKNCMRFEELTLNSSTLGYTFQTKFQEEVNFILQPTPPSPFGSMKNGSCLKP